MRKIDEMRDRLYDLLQKTQDMSVYKLVSSLIDWIDEIDSEHVEEIKKYVSSNIDKCNKRIEELESTNQKLNKELKRMTEKCDSISREKNDWKRKYSEKKGGWPSLWSLSRPDPILNSGQFVTKSKYDAAVAEKELYRKKYYYALAGIQDDSEPDDVKYYGLDITYI